ncbi:radical SAM protein [Dactylosporangium sp. CA-233914]|uniref:radical SAM protein n=1 Tax=Dactylosporangium sp. CA-233914 TaxID=3239934 RepID=UPI003D8C0699
MKALSIHLTDICNSKCSFCIVDSPHMERDTVMRRRVSRFLSEHAGQGYEGVSLHGGEATIRRDFLEILDEIRDKGYPTVHLMTNARKLARMEFARSVVDKGVSLFIVSMHGATAVTQDRIARSIGSFEQAVAGIRNVKALGATVRTNSVVCQDNYTELPEIIDLCLDLGADQITISALHTDGTALRNFWEVTPRYADIRPYVLEACARAVRRGAPLFMEGFPYCTVPGYEQHLVDWEHNRYKVLYRSFVMDDYEEHMDDFTRVKDARCGGCVFDSVCGGVYKEYAEMIGWDEFHPVTERPDRDTSTNPAAGPMRAAPR